MTTGDDRGESETAHPVDTQSDIRLAYSCWQAGDTDPQADGCVGRSGRGQPASQTPKAFSMHRLGGLTQGSRRAVLLSPATTGPSTELERRTYH